MRLFLPVLLTASFVLPPASRAETVYTLPEIRVDGARLTNDRRAVRVIDEDEIRASNAIRLGDLLARSAGVDFNSNFSGAASASLRGGSGSHTLVLVDGVRVNDPTDPTRAFDFSLLDLSQIERIEIFKGPQSVSFGSDALAGVIVVTTKKAGWRRRDLTVTGGTGTRETARVSAVISEPLNPAWTLGANLAFDHSEGSSAARVKGGEEDVRRLYNAGVSAEWRPSADRTLELGWNGKLLEQDLDAGAFLDDPNSRSRTLEHEWNASYTAAISPALETRTVVTRKAIRRAYDDPADPANPFGSDAVYRGTNHGVDAQLRWTAGARETVIGGEWTQERMDFDSFSDPGTLARDRIETWSGFIQNRMELLPGLSNDLGFRYDHSSNFEAAHGMRAGLQWIWSQRIKSSIAYGTGYKAPTLYALYAPVGAFFRGNPDLRPERSRSIDLGTEIAWGDTMSLSANFFQTRYRDLISYEAATLRSINVDSAEVRGAETELRFQASRALSVTAHATYLRAVDRATRLELPQRPRWKAGVIADWTVSDRWRLQTEFLAKTSRRDSAAGTARTPGFGIWHLSGDYGFSPGWKATVRMENVLDQDEITTLGYTPRGRTLIVGANLSF